MNKGWILKSEAGLDVSIEIERILVLASDDSCLGVGAPNIISAECEILSKAVKNSEIDKQSLTKMLSEHDIGFGKEMREYALKYLNNEISKDDFYNLTVESYKKWVKSIKDMDEKIAHVKSNFIKTASKFNIDIKPIIEKYKISEEEAVELVLDGAKKEFSKNMDLKESLESAYKNILDNMNHYKEDTVLARESDVDNKLTAKALKDMIPAEVLADKWKVDLSIIEEKLDEGELVEMEHTSNGKEARTIASHHINEDLDYYEKLEVIENN